MDKTTALPQETAVSLDRLKVLAVDDNAINRDFLRAALAERVSEFQVAESGHDALNQLAARSFDLVLMDLHMPDMDGLAAWQEACSRNSGNAPAKVIAVTADSRLEQRQQLEAEGFDGLLVKPMGLQELLKAMIRVCSGHKAFDPVSGAQAAESRLLDDERAFRANGAVHQVRQMRRAFARQLENERKLLDDMLASGDDEAATEILHQWKGACGYTGTSALAHSCEHLEQSLRRELDSSPGTLYLQLLRTLEATLAALRQSAESSPPPAHS